MFGMRDIEKVQQALVIGPDGAARVAGEKARGCDPFYRAWLRSLRRALVDGALREVPALVPDLAAPCVWVTSGEWGDTAAADLEMLTFDHGLLDVLGRDARDALVDGRPFTDAEAVLRLLADCARVHEAFEEVLMEIHRVPDREEHLEVHRFLAAEREQLCAAHAAGDLAAARSLLAALRGWSDEHAAGHDLALEGRLRASRNGR